MPGRGLPQRVRTIVWRRFCARGCGMMKEMRIYVASLGMIALLAGSATGQVFKPRGGPKATPTATAEKDGTIKSKTKSGFKRRAKAKPRDVDDEVVDDEVDDKATKRSPARKAAKLEDDDDSEVEADDSVPAKRQAVRKRPKRWDPNFVLITDDDE